MDQLSDRELAILAAVLPDDAYERFRDNHDDDIAWKFGITVERVDQLASRLFDRIRKHKVN